MASNGLKGAASAAARFFAKVKRGNAAFAKMTKARKRVAIAKDVIAALDARAIKPITGSYVLAGPENDFSDHPLGLSSKDSLRDALSTLPACHACAKGAILLCTVARRNKVSVADASARKSFNSRRLSRLLGDIFEPRQLARIESEYECAMVNRDTPQPIMGLDHLTEKARMKLIMQNIIDNGGTFKPVRAE